MNAALLGQMIWQAPRMAPVGLALLSLALAAMLWLYPPQTRGVPVRWRWMMPALRGLAVAAIAAAVVQPIVLRPRTTAREGAIVILADQSHSMSVVDRDRSPAELVSLAVGLGALPAGVRHEAVPGLSSRLEAIGGQTDQVARARSEAEYARLSGHGAPAAHVRLRDAVERLSASLRELPDLPASIGGQLPKEIAAMKHLPARADDPALQAIRHAATSASGALSQAQARADEALFAKSSTVRGVCTRLARLPREALLELGLTQQPAGVLPNLPAGVPVYGFGFGGSEGIRSIPGIVAGQTQPLNLQPSGDESDLPGAIRDVLGRMAPHPVQAMVVLSDGRQVGAENETTSGDIPAAGMPVFTVEAAAPGEARDVAITDFDVPDSARAGQTIWARIAIRVTGYGNEPIEVRLQSGAVTRLAKVTPMDDPSAGGGSRAQIATAEFELTLETAGPRELTASVLPRDGEITDENNQRTRWVRVGAESAKVLVVAGPDAGRQYASLHATLSRTPWVALSEVEEEQAPGLSVRTILDQDVIVLCDAPVGELDSAQWLAVERAARQRGAGVIVCAGRDAPGGYAADPSARSLLPYDPSTGSSWQNWPGGDLGFRLTASSDLPEEAEFLRHLSPISRIFPASPLRAGARALVSDRAGGEAILTEMKRGIGRVYFLGTDQSWRWRGERGATVDRDAFWPRMVLLAALEPYAAAERNLQLDADHLAPAPGQTISLRAQVLDAYGDPVDAPSQTVHVLQDDQLARDVTLHSLADGSGRFEGTMSSGLPAGDYMLRLDAPIDSSDAFPADPVTLRLHVARSYEREMEDVSADDRLLRRLSEASVGQFIPLDQLNTLPRRLTEVRQRQSRLVEYPLWDSPYLLVFVLACLSAEWALRKRFGLA